MTPQEMRNNIFAQFQTLQGNIAKLNQDIAQAQVNLRGMQNQELKLSGAIEALDLVLAPTPEAPPSEAPPAPPALAVVPTPEA